MKNIFLILLASTLIISPLLFSQSRSGNMNGGSIEGKVLDLGSLHTIEYANIVLLNYSDSSLVNGTVTDANGLFKLTRIKPGKYFVSIRFIGYEDDTRVVEFTPGKINYDLGEVKLHPATINLDNVVVEAERSPITYQIDKKVIDVSQMNTVVSGNAADVLENVPSVSVDIEGNVSLRGSGNFTVLVDGRPSVLSAQDALQQIPASSIDKIEIITNPSAKYDPEGSSGIINIIMKKELGSGLSGMANGNVGLNEKYGGDFLFEYKTPELKTTFGMDYNRRFYPGTSNEENIYLYNGSSSFINTTGDIERGRINYELRGGVEFYPGQTDVLSLNGRFGEREGQRKANEIKTQWSDIDPQEIVVNSIGDRYRKGNYFSLSSNYQKKFNESGHQLLGEVFFSQQSGDESTNTYELQNNVQINGRTTTEDGPSMDLRAKLDYTLPFTDFRKFDAGYQAEIDNSQENNNLYDYDPNSGIYVIQPLFSNRTKYENLEQAIYSIYSDRILNTSLQAGIRAEYTYRLIELSSTGESFNIDRWDFFPSLHASYKLSTGQQIMASYSRRINRPGGWALEPFETWIDANNVRKGNPDLQPEFIDALEGGIQTFLGNASLSTEIYYRITNNKIEFIRTAYSQDVTLTTFNNVGTDYSLGVEMLLNFDALNFWNVNLLGNVYNYRVTGTSNGESFDRESFNWRTRLNNTFKFGKSTQVQWNLNYQSPTVSSQGRWEEFFTTDLAVRQEIIENTLALTLQVRDLLGTSKREFSFENNDLFNYSIYQSESPMIMLNLRFTFNNYKPNRERPANSGMENGSTDDF